MLIDISVYQNIYVKLSKVNESKESRMTICSNWTPNTKESMKRGLNVRWFPSAPLVSQSTTDSTEKGELRRTKEKERS